MDHLILNSYQLSTTKDENSTHFYWDTHMYFSLNDKRKEEFWITYCNSVVEKNSTQISEVIPSKNTNVQLGYYIFMIFDANYAKDMINPLVQSIKIYLKRLIGLIQITIKNHFKQTESGSEYLACYLDRGDDNFLTWNNSQVEYKGKIIFPYALVQNKYISQFFKLVVSQIQLHSNELQMYLPIPLLNGLDTLIRPLNLDTCELYGSYDIGEKLTYELQNIYGLLSNESETIIDFSSAFSPSHHSDVKSRSISIETLSKYAMKYGWTFWLPLFFSIGYWGQSLSEIDGAFMNEEVPTIITLKTFKELNESQTQLEKARQFLALINISRVDVYWSWYDIGSAIHSIDQGTDGLNAWKYITTRSDFKSDYDCDVEWFQFDQADGVTSNTLEWFVYQDNPDQYNKIVEKDVADALNKAIFEQKHTPVAKAFKACFPFDFICSNYESGTWYYYQNHRWIEDDGSSMIIYYLNEQFQNRLDVYRNELSNKKLMCRDPEIRTRMENNISSIGELIKKLSTPSFKEGVCKELKTYYHHRSFNKLMNSIPYYTATPNGVIDVRGGSYYFRPGKPEDYITMSTQCMFPITFTWETPTVIEVMKYLGQVFQNVNKRNYFWRFMGKILYSGNVDKVFPIWTGEGDNSKSILVRLILAALGMYAVKLPYTLITEQIRDSNKATPVLIHSRGAKIGFLEEPNKGHPIQSGTVKHLTGHDTLPVRELFQKGSKMIDMEVTMVPVLITNKIPKIPDCQRAIWERTNVLEFTSQWSKHASDDINEQYQTGIFKIDRFFERQIPRLAPAFLWVMAQKYEEYCRFGLDPPEEVLEATDAFRISNNRYIHFTRACVKEVLTLDGTPDMNAKVHLDELYSMYNRWYSDQKFKEKIENKSEFKENIEMVWKRKAPEYYWFGIQVVGTFGFNL